MANNFRGYFLPHTVYIVGSTQLSPTTYHQNILMGGPKVKPSGFVTTKY